MSVAENLILTKREVRFKREEIRDFTLRTIRDYNIIAPSVNTPVRFLSGGNQQLLIVARELSAPQPKVLIAESPTHGLDIARTNLIHQKLQELKAKGCGILLVSEDLDEIIERSDRVAVIYRGKIVALRRPAEYNREELSLLMTTGRSLR
jgi:simple sugar transport system ATP-binding protein